MSPFFIIPYFESLEQEVTTLTLAGKNQSRLCFSFVYLYLCGSDSIIKKKIYQYGRRYSVDPNDEAVFGA